VNVPTNISPPLSHLSGFWTCFRLIPPFGYFKRRDSLFRFPPFPAPTPMKQWVQLFFPLGGWFGCVQDLRNLHLTAVFASPFPFALWIISSDFFIFSIPIPRKQVLPITKHPPPPLNHPPPLSLPSITKGNLLPHTPHPAGFSQDPTSLKKRHPPVNLHLLDCSPHGFPPPLHVTSPKIGYPSFFFL